MNDRDDSDMSDSNDRKQPRDNGDNTPLASNGEGPLGPIDASWQTESTITPARERIAYEADRIGLARAVAESMYVSDVFFTLQLGPLERYEGLLVALGRCVDGFAKLRPSYTGTVAGEFVRWCRCSFPGMLASDLAELLNSRGLGLVEQFQHALEAAAKLGKGRGREERT
jgi:hypothetical protein